MTQNNASRRRTYPHFGKRAAWLTPDRLYLNMRNILSVNAPVLKHMLTKSPSLKAFRTGKPFILNFSKSIPWKRL
ncbi:hypothetical protein DQG23_23050 [Paenibacillus contaminans]|uniref:Uncharacterized protein n=1 Tax=Paenibacillus contaminans TaxID=450362 RepID=A0A329MJW3_9BACL|nr:hypothetical protein DQG23_23050 [Paenibacillus contaminans]